MSDTPAPSPLTPSRREVLAGIAGTAALALSPLDAVAAALKDLKPLLAASQRLTGIPLDLSYLDIGQIVWNTMRRSHGEAPLVRLLAVVNGAPEGSDLAPLLRRHDLLPIAQELTSLWYTGSTARKGRNGGTALFYNDALMWRSCAFTKPPATCGGPFGYWENPYAPAGADDRI
ncbi:sugar dehydrogenase complex small subunit [Azospirillum picis]|uniref:Membrane bound FAD containing D-sorbitol dehydrogenase n=1 Tax=Azospirillum picis TaxID=488438 RepID=A0ABU0MLX6_9PROT|nr:sugar dehydrogenase complex small subunit [Azospirillum picis]MBP2300984.1 hypothetical protein [Azospirillum picis]MDQ0534396.1 hypothetical protein [Azospirillum picis]